MPDDTIRGRNNRTPEEKRLALAVLAKNNGNTRATERELAKQGVKIPARTLYDWRTKYMVDEYLQIRDEILPGLKAKMAESLEEIALKGSEVQMAILERLEKAVPRLDEKELGRNLREVSIPTGIAVQRSGELRGDATVVIGHENPEIALKKLRAMGVIESDAEEVSEAELVEKVDG